MRVPRFPETSRLTRVSMIGLLRQLATNTSKPIRFPPALRVPRSEVIDSFGVEEADQAKSQTEARSAASAATSRATDHRCLPKECGKEPDQGRT